MTDLRQPAQQALEAYEQHEPLAVVMQDLRTALEKQAEPVAWMDREGDLYRMPVIENWSPPHTLLYTHPPQRKPLTDEQIEELDDQVRQVTIDKGDPVGWFAMQLARAIEAAHGIGEKK